MTPHLPLSGLRVIELAGIGPGPFCGMMLADHGAEVIRIDRPGGVQAGVAIDAAKDVLLRSRRTMSIDLKCEAGVEVVKRLAVVSDGLFEGFRPGVAERLGLGPEDLLALNPNLVFGRMTGWGQDGPYAGLPGHDINYVAISGALNAIGRADEAPVAPLNLLGDYGGGGLLLAFGMVSAMLAVRNGAKGQVVDCAMTEGVSALMAGIWSLRANGRWEDQRGSNLLDGGAPYYDCYATQDGRYMAVGAIEERFYRRLVSLLGFAEDPDFARQEDRGHWPAMRLKLASRFAERTQAEWSDLLAGDEVCVAPVMAMGEAPSHPQNLARRAFLEVEGVVQPRPAPRFGSGACKQPQMWREDNATAALLREIGYGRGEIERLRAAGAFGSLEAVT